MLTVDNPTFNHASSVSDVSAKNYTLCRTLRASFTCITLKCATYDQPNGCCIDKRIISPQNRLNRTVQTVICSSFYPKLNYAFFRTNLCAPPIATTRQAMATGSSVCTSDVIPPSHSPNLGSFITISPAVKARMPDPTNTRIGNRFNKPTINPLPIRRWGY